MYTHNGLSVILWIGIWVNWTHKASSAPPLFIRVSVPSQESDQLCIYVMGIHFTTFYDFPNWLWKYSDSVVLFFICFILALLTVLLYSSIFIIIDSWNIKSRIISIIYRLIIPSLVTKQSLSSYSNSSTILKTKPYITHDSYPDQSTISEEKDLFMNGNEYLRHELT
jgi:hypothetical protein